MLLERSYDLDLVAVELARENVTRNGFLEDLVDKSDGEVGDKVEAKMGGDSNQNGIDGDDKNAKQKIAHASSTCPRYSLTMW